MSSTFIVQPKKIIHNPDSILLKKLVSDMPNAKLTEFNNYNVQVNVKARSKKSTFIVSDNPKKHSDQTITFEEYDRIKKIQNDYIKSSDMIVIDGFIGAFPKTRTPVRLFVEKKNANIAAMQKQLYFSPEKNELQDFKPQLNVIYTPNLKAEGFPDNRLIAVNLKEMVTRIFNSDYFGESKKAGLRMWNKLIYDNQGLALHSGCKMIPTHIKNKYCLIIGLSGTGKTTTTFSNQNDSIPLQDDFIGWLSDGSVIGSENGCFAKTFGLNKESEPAIYDAVTQNTAFLENVSIQSNGKIDFSDSQYTKNGRATFPFSAISNNDEKHDISCVDHVLILNKNNSIIPAVVKLNNKQAAAYFVLGETQGTSAGGAEEAGKALRIAGTNPFFPLLHGLQGNRFLKLLLSTNASVYLLNTGYIDALKNRDNAHKIKIHHSSMILKGIAEETITWEKDPDFSYQIAKHVPGIDTKDDIILYPKKHYTKEGRLEEYNDIVKNLKKERLENLLQYPELNTEIVESIR